MDLRAWMDSATRPGPFSPPGLIVAINDHLVICGVDGAGSPLTAAQYWPLSCLTKLALADLAFRALDLDAAITRWLPEVSTAPTVRALLTHTAGLPLDLDPAQYGAIDRNGVKARTLSALPSCSPGNVSYSNLGYGWIAYALERATGQSLTTLLQAYELTWGDTLDTEPVVIADIRSPHTGTSIEPLNSAYWRSLRLPWAGAFGTIPAVARLLRRLDSRVRETRVVAPGGFPQGFYFGGAESPLCMWADAAWGCGVEFRGTKTPHWITPAAPIESYGHIASTGILVWTNYSATITIAGPRGTNCGWLMRHGPKGSALAFHHAEVTPASSATPPHTSSPACRCPSVSEASSGARSSRASCGRSCATRLLA